MMKTYTMSGFAEWKETDVSMRLRASSADTGGGSEVLIISDCSRYVQPQDNRRHNDEHDGKKNG